VSVQSTSDISPSWNNIYRKRPSPDSPQDLAATLKQETKQTRRRNSVGDLRQKKKTQTMADKVIESLINPTVLNQIVPKWNSDVVKTQASPA
jgi:hypothetical protein